MSRLGPRVIAADDTTLPAVPAAATIGTTAQGCFGQDVSAKSGLVYVTAGTFGFASGVVSVQGLASGGAGTVGSPWTGWEAGIAAAPADSIIFFPPGYYTQATSITLGSTIRAITGYGAKITYSGVAGYAFAVADAAGNPARRLIEGIELTGNATAAGGFDLGVTLEANWFGPWWLRDVYVTGFTTGKGIRTKYSGYHALENCHVYSNDYGIYSEVGSNAVTLLNCVANGNTTAGIYASGCRVYNIRGGAVESSAQGVVLVNGVYVVDGVYFEANTTRDVNLGASVSARITHCYFNSTATDAVAITGLTNGWSLRDNYYNGTYVRYVTDYWSVNTAYQYGKVDENRVNMALAYRDFFLNPYFSDGELSGNYTDVAGNWRTATKRGAQLSVGVVATTAPLYGTFTVGSQYWHETPGAGAAPGAICTVAGTAGTLAGPATTSTTSVGTTSLTFSTAAIEGLSRATACVVTWTGHTMQSGDLIGFSGITQAGWTALNGTHRVTYVGVNEVSIAVDTSGYAADYVPGTDPGVYSNSAGIYLGCRITIAGVTGAKVIVAYTGLGATLESNADATVTDTVAYQAPTWTAMASLP